jgi:hypothetical protein
VNPVAPFSRDPQGSANVGQASGLPGQGGRPEACPTLANRG